MCELAFMNAKDTDQPMHPHSLIKIYIVNSHINNTMYEDSLSTCVDSDNYDWEGEHANLDIHCLEMPTCTY